MEVCCVDGCPGPGKDEPYFFQLPLSRILRKRWLDAIRADKLTEHAMVCRLHFNKRDYDMVRGKVRLKSKVVPSLSAEETETTDTNNTKRKASKRKLDTQTDTNYEHSDNKRKQVTRNSKHNDDMVIDKSDNDIINNHNERDQNHSEKDDKGINDRVNNDSSVKDSVDNRKNDDSTHNDKDNKSVNDKKDDNRHLNCKDMSVQTENLNNDCIHNNNDNSDKIINATNENEKISGDNGIVSTKVLKPSFVNGVTETRDKSSRNNRRKSISVPETGNGDIEEYLKHYCIENKKTELQVAAMTESYEPVRKRGTGVHQESMGTRPNVGDEGSIGNGWPVGVQSMKDPVYIEVSVGPESNNEELSKDCMMVLESVQVDVDPALLLEACAEDGFDRVDLDDISDPPTPERPDPISLVTSSDDDDVILEEPQIDIVEVSDETDEDDVPLVKLVKAKVKKKKKEKILSKVFWPQTNLCCLKCGYTATSSSDYKKHVQEHSKVLQVCQECGYTSCSKSQLQKHVRQHKLDKRYKCSQCNYSAKHNMSLVYHLKTHNHTAAIVGCAKKMMRNSKQHSCSHCEYSTDRRSDLRRHMARLHPTDSDDDDDEYIVPC